jgi:hypothetical protein
VITDNDPIYGKDNYPSEDEEEMNSYPSLLDELVNPPEMQASDPLRQINADN